jgi:hypothetical protein
LCACGYGKVAVLEELRNRLRIGHGRIVYVGDPSSDVHVMLHVNRLSGHTIAVSENRYITPIASRTILSEDALSVLVPILEDIAGWESIRIRAFFEAQRPRAAPPARHEEQAGRVKRANHTKYDRDSPDCCSLLCSREAGRLKSAETNSLGNLIIRPARVRQRHPGAAHH